MSAVNENRNAEIELVDGYADTIINRAEICSEIAELAVKKNWDRADFESALVHLIHTVRECNAMFPSQKRENGESQSSRKN